jgi:esterase/lipase superfamily enzyme
MLMFTNRVMSNSPNEAAFGTSFRQGSGQLGMASVTGSTKKGWAVSAPDSNVGDDKALNALVPLFKGTKRVLVYIHGNNNTPAQCFKRCDALQTLYGVEVIGFSWPSEGYSADGTIVAGVLPTEVDGDENELAKVTAGNRGEGWIRSKINRYHQATLNGKHSGDALARFLRLLATARLYANGQVFTLAAHSLGAQYLEYTLDLSGASESASAAQNILLLAPCVRSSGHKDWLIKMRPKGQLFVTFNQGDSVLMAASIADNGSGPKLGTDPTTDLLRVPYMRYISCTNAAKGLGGHGYFVKDNMSKAMERVFGRIFASDPDMNPGEIDRHVYGMKGDEDGLTKYFNAP